MTEITHNGKLAVGIATRQGYRARMEDDHVTTHLPAAGHTLLAVFDGHGDAVSAQFSAAHLKATLISNAQWDTYATTGCCNFNPLAAALRETFLALEAQLLAASHDEQGWRSGCTALVAVITPTHVVVANAGDSRAVLGTMLGTGINLTSEHRLTNDDERRRVIAAGGVISRGRVDGHLMPTRAIGDMACNDMSTPPEMHKVTALPDVSVYERLEDDDFVILACDGVWDVMESETAVSFVQAMLAYPQKTMQDAAEGLAETCLAQGSTDNISIVLMEL